MEVILIELCEKVWVVVPEAPPRYPYGNCMYIEAECPTIIDLGAGGRAFSEIVPEQVEIGLISHFHFDHIHGDSFFPNARLYAGWQEEDIYHDPEKYLESIGYNIWDILMPGIPKESFANTVSFPPDVPVRPGFRNIPLAGTFGDLTKIDLGNQEIMAIHLPGHTAGHYGFLLEKEGILFSADIDMVAAGPWYACPSADVEGLITSVQRIKEIDPRILVTSHRRILTEGIPERLNRYIQVVLERQEKILEMLNKPYTLDELAGRSLIFSEHNNQFDVFWEKLSICKHLCHLMRENMITEVEKGIFQRN